MSRLVLLNGPPACGKSTLAHRFVEEHPLSLNLDIDRIRSMIGRWRDEPHAAGLLARDVALAAARTHLISGHDVVLPQFLGRLPFIEQLEGLARDVDAVFHEIVLLDSKRNILRRFAERSQAAEDPAHVEAQEMIDRSVLEDLSMMYDRLLSVIDERPHAKIVHIEEGKVDLAFRAVLSNLA
jgi:predicted kinase